jgi:methylase of polypeptide subunit release factors
VVERLGQLLKKTGFGGSPHSELARLPGGMPEPEVLMAAGRADAVPLATLVTLFDREAAVAPGILEQALEGLTIAQLVDAGLLETYNGDVRARVKVNVLDGLLVAGDPVRASDSPDYVLTVTPASVAVAGSTIRRRAKTVLDLGTGSGVQALLAARHGRTVTGVDINGHALSCAAISQKLNGVRNVEWMQGDWFEPVRGKRFDLIVVNPAIIITPDHTVLYRDSRVRAQELSRHLVSQSAEHLNEGGFATLLCHWTNPQGAWDYAPREWVADLGCDALVLYFGSRDPLAYAMNHAVTGPDHDPADIARTVTRWARYYRDTGIEQMSSGAIVLRRRSKQKNWVQALQLPGLPTPAGSRQLERMFAGADLLASDQQLDKVLSTRWRLVDDTVIDQTLVRRDGGYASTPALLRQEPAVPAAVVDPRVVPLLVACDGRRSLSDLLAQSPTPEGLAQSQFNSLAINTAGDLIARGLLVGR